MSAVEPTNGKRALRRATAYPDLRECGNNVPPAVPVPAYFEREHRRLDAQLHAHLLDVAGGDFGCAQRRLQSWRQELTHHIAIEENELLPHLPGDARWGARVYQLEHERITVLAASYEARLNAVVEHPPHSVRARREAVLALLEAVHPLRHLVEHHHQREEMALANELPHALLEAAWNFGDISDARP